MSVLTAPSATTSWWSELGHFGQTLHAGLAPKLTLAEPPHKAWAALSEALPDFRAWLELTPAKRDRDHAPLLRWVDAVLEGFLGHSPQDFLKASSVGDAWKAKAPGGYRDIKPDRVLRLVPPAETHALPIFISTTPLSSKEGKRRALDLDRFLRVRQEPMGLLTDGQALRWVVLGTHQNAFTQWDLLAGWSADEARSAWQGLFTLLGHGQGWTSTPQGDRPHQLGQWLLESGRMQGELSTTLGEQIREAVETLVHALDHWSQDRPERMEPLAQVEPDPARQNQALYTAAVRLVMRLVVIAFAESRDLLPTTFPAYRESYGLEALWQRLKRAKGEVGFDLQQCAWMQILGLFRLVHGGSTHPDMPLRGYGGDLFLPGDPEAGDPVTRALSLWESDGGVPVSDAAVLRILTLLKQTTVRVAGKAYATPVDFSTLSTEYIGLLYEGLLDYDLRTAQGPMLLLNLGQQPLLPLHLLEARNDKDLKELLETLAKEKAGKAAAEEEEEGEDEGDDKDDGEEEEPEEAEAEAAEEAEPGEMETAPDDLVAEAWAWAREAVRLMPSRFGLGPARRGQAKAQKPAGMDPLEWEARLQKAARLLVARIIPPGERYLIRWSGTRKGSGTFYTRPSLTEPLIRETLRPLCYAEDGTPRPPETILALRVVDPAMGSASFLVGALRYLTEALYESVVHHRVLATQGEHLTLTLPMLTPALGVPQEDLPPIHAEDPEAEPKLKQRLKRYVVERCLYGVDLNPLAVELAKLAIWVETLDRHLPFGFLDHKFRCGNALVGCWLDRVDDYPIRAWDREGGDGKDGKETKALKEIFKAAKKDLEEELFAGTAWTLAADHPPAQEVLPRAREALAAIHELPVNDADLHGQQWHRLLHDPAIQALQGALDRWCALFFWPGLGAEGGEIKPKDAPLPGNWRGPEFRNQVQALASRHRFFHWELAFPEVFTGPSAGFHAVLGNPPWDTVQPESLEFFTRFDPIYRTYGKQEALAVQKRLFAQNPAFALEWNGVLRDVRALTSFIKFSANPFDVSLGRGKDPLLEQWATRRLKGAGFSDPKHPYTLQGSGKVYTYKLFLEVARASLRQGGRLGFVVPSGLYTDAGAKDLRDVFLNTDGWELLFGFENRQKIFQIDSRFKFVLTVLTKNQPNPTRPLQAAFMRLDTGELSDPQAHTLPVTPALVRRFAPNTLSFMELRSTKDLAIAEKLYADHPLLGDLGLCYSQEFNMTSDSGLWKEGSRAKLVAAGLLGPEDDTRDIRVRFRLWKAGWVPLMEGKHFWQFNPYYLGNDTESGLKKFLDGQRFIARDALRQVAQEQWERARDRAEKNDETFGQTLLDFMPWVRPRLVYRDIARSTDRRTYISSLIPAIPHGNKSPDISLEIPSSALCALLNSFTIDWVIRRKVSATLNKFYIETLPIPSLHTTHQAAIATRASRLTGVNEAPMGEPAERLRIRAEIDALVAHAYDLTEDEFSHILLDMDCGAVGFRKTDEGLPAAHRQPQLTLDAYRQLLHKGLDRFLLDGAEIPEAALAHPRPLIEIWSPEGGWDEAWSEARAIASSQHEWDLFLGKEEAVLAEYAGASSQPAPASTPRFPQPSEHPSLFAMDSD